MTDLNTSALSLDTGPAREHFVRSLLTDPLGLLAAMLLTIVVLTAIFAPVLAPNDPTQVLIFKVNAPPGDGYLLGGDGLGRDIFSRLIFGARNTLLGAVVAVVGSSLIGVTAGLFAGYHSRRLDLAASWVFDAPMALPAIIVLLALYQSLGSSMHISMVVFGVLLSPGFFRLTGRLELVPPLRAVEAAALQTVRAGDALHARTGPGELAAECFGGAVKTTGIAATDGASRQRFHDMDFADGELETLVDAMTLEDLVSLLSG